jgi:hypothetical protein
MRRSCPRMANENHEKTYVYFSQFPMMSLYFFSYWPNPSSCTMALGSTQPLTETCTSKIITLTGILLHIYQRFGNILLPSSSSLRMETASYSETMLTFYQATRRYIPEYSNTEQIGSAETKVISTDRTLENAPRSPQISLLLVTPCSRCNRHR